MCVVVYVNQLLSALVFVICNMPIGDSSAGSLHGDFCLRGSNHIGRIVLKYEVFESAMPMLRPWQPTRGKVAVKASNIFFTIKNPAVNSELMPK